MPGQRGFMVRSFFSGLKFTTAATAQSKSPRRFEHRHNRRALVLRTAIESLESRLLMSTVTFHGTGDFGDVTKWSTGVIPNSGDTAVIPAGANMTVSTADGTADLDMISAAAGSTITVGPGGVLRAREGGTIAGTLNVAATGMVSESYSGNTLNLSGASTFSGDLEADDASTVINTGVVTFLNGGGVVAGNFINKSNVTATGGMLLGGGEIFTNTAGATFTITDDGGFDPYTYPGVGAGTFINNGTFIKTGGTGITSFPTTPSSDTSVFDGGTFENIGGTIQINSGTVVVRGTTYLQDTTFNVATGASFQLTNERTDNFYTTSLEGTIVGTGGGTVVFDKGNFQTYRLSDSNDDVTASLNFPDGMLSINTADFSLINGQVNADEVTNLGFITVNHPTTLTASDSLEILNQGTIRNVGPGGLAFERSVNDTSGVIDLQTDGGISGGFNNIALTNKGMLRKSAGSGNSIISSTFENDGGTLDIETGTISFTAGSIGYIAGPINIATGAVLNFNTQFGTFLQGTFTSTGGGTVTVTSGYLTGPTQSQAADESDTGSATLDFGPGVLNFNGGYTDDTSSHGNISNAGYMNFVDGDNLGGMSNTGTIIINAGEYEVFKGSTWDNLVGGIFMLEGGVTLTTGAINSTINNAGTFVIDAGTATTDLATPYPYDTYTDVPSISNTGVFEVKSGTMIYPSASLGANSIPAGAGFKVDAGAQLTTEVAVPITEIDGSVTLGGASASFPDLAGLATVNGSFAVLSGAMFSTTGSLTNAGTLSVGGTLTVNGNLTESASTSTLDFPVAAAAGTPEAPNLTVTGATALAGNLTAEYSGGFAAAGGSAFTVANFATPVSGSFASTSGTAPDFNASVGTTTISLNGNAVAAGDLQVAGVTAPASFTPGQNGTISWTVTNAGASTTSDWVDSVYLSATGTLGAGDLFLGNVSHTGGLTESASYTGSLTVPFPAAAGSYKVVVVTDSMLVVGDINRANNVAVSSAIVSTLPSLTVGGSVTGTLTGGQDIVYQLNVTGGQDIVLTGAFAVAGGSDIEVSRGAYPGLGAGQYSAHPDTTTGNQSIRIPSATAGLYYIRITGEPVAGSADTYTLSASVPAQGASGISSISLGQGVDSPTLFGSGFTTGSTVTLVDASGTVVATASSVAFTNANSITPTFDLSSVPTGSYSLIVTTGGTASAPIAVTVVASSPSLPLQITMTAPSETRDLRNYDIVITYHNPNNFDVSPVWVVLEEAGLDFRLAGGNADATIDPNANFSLGSINLATINQEGDASKLGPGYTGQLLVEFHSETNEAHNTYNPILSQVAGTTDLADFVGNQAGEVSDLAATILLERIDGRSYPTTALSGAITYAAVPQLTVNDADLSNYLFSIASTLSKANVYEASLDNLLAYALDSADLYGSVTARQQSGSFGYGSTDLLRYRLVFPQSTTYPPDVSHVTFESPGGTRSFSLVDGFYVSDNPDDQGRLTLVNGKYGIIDADGTFYEFDAKNNLSYVQSPSGLKTTYNRNASEQITSIVGPTGLTTSYTYNSMGVVTSSVAPNGETTTYGYKVDTQPVEIYDPQKSTFARSTSPFDASTISIPLLSTITSPQGTSTITWTSTPQIAYDFSFDVALQRTAAVGYYTSLPTDEFLPTSITATDGSGEAFTYDDQGRVIASSELDGSLPMKYSYDSSGFQVTTTAPDGTTTTTILGIGGEVLRQIAPDGSIITDSYTGPGQELAAAVSPDGETTKLTYANGTVTSALNADGSGRDVHLQHHRASAHGNDFDQQHILIRL